MRVWIILKAAPMDVSILLFMAARPKREKHCFKSLIDKQPWSNKI